MVEITKELIFGSIIMICITVLVALDILDVDKFMYILSLLISYLFGIKSSRLKAIIRGT